MPPKVEQNFINLTPEHIIPTIKTGLSNVGFLFGAGTSHEAGFPLTLGLTKSVIENLDNANATHLQSILDAENRINGTKDSLIEGKFPDIERILNLVLGHKYSTTGDELEKSTKLEKDIKDSIVKELTSINNPDFKNHIEFLSIIKRKYNNQPKPFWIFTTNYDMLFETAAMYPEISIRNGFEGIGTRYFNLNKIDASQGFLTGQQFTPCKESYCNLIKLHGSVSWYEQKGKVFEILDNNNLDEEFNRVMIHPQQTKVSETYAIPYQNLFDYANKTLGKNCKFLATCGYSFRDEHINNRLLIPKLENGSLRIVAILQTLPDNIADFTKYNCFNYITATEALIDGTKYPLDNCDLWKFSKFVEFLKR